MTQREKEDITIQTTITVNDSCETLYNTWREVRNFSTIFDFPESVIRIDQNRFRFTTFIKEQNERLSWDLEITEENPPNYFSWHSSYNADLLHDGSVRFIPQQNNKTEIQLALRFFFPPLQDSKPFMMGAEFKTTIEDNLRRFKQAWEAKSFTLFKENLNDLPEGLSTGPLIRKSFTTEYKKGDNQKNEPPAPYLH